MSDKLFYLLQVNDALFPIGGYSHSQGLETYIQKGIVRDEKTAEEYILHKLKWNMEYTELLAVRLAWERAVASDLDGLMHLEEILEASRLPAEQRDASKKMGSRFIKTVEKLGIPEVTDGIFADYVAARFDEWGVPYVRGGTWTTDGLYRETRANMEKRRAEGCLAVEMEVSAIQAVCDYHGMELYNFLLCGDLLDAPEWDERILNQPGEADVQWQSLLIALELARSLQK